MVQSFSKLYQGKKSIQGDRCIIATCNQRVLEIAKKQHSEYLFQNALRFNRSHLLRLFVVLWKFDISNEILKKCILWIQNCPDRTQKYKSCETECRLLLV